MSVLNLKIQDFVFEQHNVWLLKLLLQTRSECFFEWSDLAVIRDNKTMFEIPCFILNYMYVSVAAKHHCSFCFGLVIDSLTQRSWIAFQKSASVDELTVDSTLRRAIDKHSAARGTTWLPKCWPEMLTQKVSIFGRSACCCPLTDNLR